MIICSGICRLTRLTASDGSVPLLLRSTRRRRSRSVRVCYHGETSPGVGMEARELGISTVRANRFLAMETRLADTPGQRTFDNSLVAVSYKVQSRASGSTTLSLCSVEESIVPLLCCVHLDRTKSVYVFGLESTTLPTQRREN